MKRVYLDTETTSIVPGQIAELTVIVEDTDTNQLLAAQNWFFTVDDMDKGAEEVHGLSKDILFNLSGGYKFSDKLNEILPILDGAELVAHNEVFDERFISTELWRCGISYRPASRLCTMEIFKPILAIPSKYKKYGKYKNPKLEEVLNYLNISPEKVSEYSKKLFNYDGETNFHDSRFDTTGMYVAVNVYREKLHGGNAWHNAFCM